MITIEIFNPGHYGIFKGEDHVGSIYRVIRSGLRTWHVSNFQGETVFRSFYLRTAKDHAKERLW